MSWFVDPELLIMQVESHPLLYVKGLPDYSNKIMKNKAWKEISKKLSEDWDTLSNEEKNNRCRDAQAKWKHLRDNFRREYIISSQGTKKKKKYRYFEQLLFLGPHIKEVPTSENYSNSVTEFVTMPDIETLLMPAEEDSPAGPSTACDEVIETPKKKIKKPSFEDDVLKALKNEMSDTDEDRTFCLSLVQSLKKMDDDNKMLAKIEILKVIRTFSNRSLHS